MDVQKMTREYYAKYHPTHGRMTPSTVEPDLLDSRRAMWDEEVTEVADAWTDFQDADEEAIWIGGRREKAPITELAHLLHELADVVYVAYGTAERLGVDLDDVIVAVHRANMRKVPSTDDGKATKPAGWVPADEVIRELVRRADTPAALPFVQPVAPDRLPVRDDLSGPGPVFEARYHGVCPECGDEIEPGDHIRMVDGSAEHAECSEE